MEEEIFIFYAMLPFDSIRLALADLNLIERSRLKSFQMVKRATNSEANMKTQIEEVKFFEQAFEALPQLILSATFYYNHMEYVNKCDTQVPIIELPMTLGP